MEGVIDTETKLRTAAENQLERNFFYNKKIVRRLEAKKDVVIRNRLQK